MASRLKMGTGRSLTVRPVFSLRRRGRAVTRERTECPGPFPAILARNDVASRGGGILCRVRRLPADRRARLRVGKDILEVPMRLTGGRTTCGQGSGVLMSGTVFLRPRGDIGYALSFGFPVRYKTGQVTVDDRLQDVVADGFDAGPRYGGCGSGQECRAGRSAVAGASGWRRPMTGTACAAPSPEGSARSFLSDLSQPHDQQHQTMGSRRQAALGRCR